MDPEHDARPELPLLLPVEMAGIDLAAHLLGEFVIRHVAVEDRLAGVVVVELLLKHPEAGVVVLLLEDHGVRVHRRHILARLAVHVVVSGHDPDAGAVTPAFPREIQEPLPRGLVFLRVAFERDVAAHHDRIDGPQSRDALDQIPFEPRAVGPIPIVVGIETLRCFEVDV